VKISDGGLDDPRVQILLACHFRSARSQTAPGSAHALDLRDLTAPNVLFWHAADGDEVIGIGALKRLSASHGEIKSMHTAESSRRVVELNAISQHETP
jgi:putative acetyltransferase